MGGTSWRRAFCTSLPRNSSDSPFTDKQTQNPNPNPSPSPRSRIKFGFLSSSNPSTPRFQSPSPSLRCRTAPPTETKDSISGEIKTPVSVSGSLHASNPSSPKSPSRFSLFKTSLRLSKNNCGICLQNVKTGQGTAIFTAECSHAFHFPCIAGHVNKFGSLVCPVCNVNWREVPLLAIHKNNSKPEPKVILVEQSQQQQQSYKTKSSSSPRDAKNQSKPKPSLYDDDEPLLSPRFNPIPEAADEDEEEEEEEEEEFQGFFVNSVVDSQHHLPRDTRKVDVKLLPQAAVISVGRTHETYAVVLKIKAPAPPSATAHNSKTTKLLDPGRRAPIDLVTVLDVSGTMTGAKLQMLKRAMRLVVASLGSADRLSIIAFNSSPKRLLALRRMTCQGQRSARRIIDRLACTQAGDASSSVGEALRKATKVLEDRRERNPVASVMLLSDGQGQDDGGTHRRRGAYADVSKSSTRFAHLEIPLTHEPAEDAFAKCVGGLLSVVVQDLRLKLGFCSGSTPVEIVGVYSCNGRPTSLGSGSGLVRLGDLYAEEERELLVELRVPVGSTGPVGLVDAVGVHHVMAVRCSYRDPSSQETINGREESLLVPRPRDVRSSDPKFERLRNLFVTNRAIAEARRCIEHNELSTAHRMLTSARALIKQCSSNSVDEYIDGLDIELKELNHQRHYQRQQTFPSQVMMQRQRTNEREPQVAYLDDNGEPLTPTSAWRAAEKLAKVAIMRKSMNKVGDLHGFENARF